MVDSFCQPPQRCIRVTHCKQTHKSSVRNGSPQEARVGFSCRPAGVGLSAHPGTFPPATMDNVGRLRSDIRCELCQLVPAPALLLIQPKPPEVQTKLGVDKAPSSQRPAHAPFPDGGQDPQAERSFYDVCPRDSSGPLLQLSQCSGSSRELTNSSQVSSRHLLPSMALRTESSCETGKRVSELRGLRSCQHSSVRRLLALPGHPEPK